MNDGLVKICGLKTEADIEVCLAAGVDLFGFNFHPPSPRYIEPAEAARLIERYHLRERAAAVVVDRPLDELERLVGETGAGIVQLHGGADPVDCQEVKRYARVIRAFRAREATVLEEMAAYDVDWLLLDAYSPDSPGGTGLRVDAALARRVCAEREVLLAGGLTPECVAAAIRTVRPRGVDVASGVEASPGRKSPERIRRFVAEARAAFAQPTPDQSARARE